MWRPVATEPTSPARCPAASFEPGRDHRPYCGGVGLNAIQSARRAGAGRIIAVDLRSHKLDLAQAFGATDVVNGAEDDPVRAVKSLTNRLGTDVTFDVTGHLPAMEQAVAMTRRGGQTVFVGMPGFEAQMTLPVQNALISAQRTFRGCVYGGVDVTTDIPTLAADYLAGDLLLDELISHRISLHEVNEAFAKMTAGEVARSVITFDYEP